MHVILCVKIAFVFIASAVAVPVALTAGDSQLENLDKRAIAAAAPIVPNNLQSFTCPTSTSANRVSTIPAQSALVPIRNACGTPGAPKANTGTPFFPLDLKNLIVKTGPFFKTPLPRTNSATFVIYTADCRLAGFQSNSITFKPANAPARNNGVSVRKRPLTGVIKRQEAQIEERAANVPASLKSCIPKFL